MPILNVSLEIEVMFENAKSMVRKERFDVWEVDGI